MQFWTGKVQESEKITKFEMFHKILTSCFYTIYTIYKKQKKKTSKIFETQ